LDIAECGRNRRDYCSVRDRVRSAFFRYAHDLAFVLRTSFWPVWCILTTAAAFCTAWLFRQAGGRGGRERRTPDSARFNRSRRTTLVLTGLAVLLAGYTAMLLVWEDFTWYDDSIFTTLTLRGTDFPVPFWPESGRFYPLGLQEFNVIRHFAKTVAGYHAFPVLELLVLAFLLLLLDDELSLGARVALAILALVTPPVVTSFMGLVYPERNLLLLLACLALFVKRFEQTRAWPWAVAAVVSAQFMLYLKEPVFLLLLTFSATRIILRIRDSKDTDPERRLDLCLAAVSVMFLIYYAIAVLPYSSALYLVSNRVSLGNTLRFYINGDPLVWVFAAVVVTRLYRILRRKAVPEPLWDGLACGVFVYFLAYLEMRLTSYYYLAPVDLIAVLYLGRLVLLSWGEMRLGFRVAAATVLALLAYQNLDLSSYLTLKRKYLIQQKAATASKISARFKQHPEQARRLYFPFTTAYMLAEFAAYLNYQGVPVEVAGEQSNAGARVKIFGGKIVGDGRCVVYRDFICHPGAAADNWSMVVVLPDDSVLAKEVAFYTQSSDKFWSYDHKTHVPELLMRWLSYPWREK
jgi:hypothetical protein